MKDSAIDENLTHPSPFPGGDKNFIGGVADKNEVIEQLLVPFSNTDLSAYGGFAQIK